MSAIAGIIDWNKRLVDSRENLSNMLKTIAHRGDKTTLDLDGFAALGHGCKTSKSLRFTIQERDYIVLLDGEIYNASQLERSLGVSGMTTTQLILRAYLKWGISFPKMLEGAFAIAIWDTQIQRLILARDRFGSRPLFFYQEHDCFLFASEPKALLAHPGVPAIIDRNGIQEIFALLPAKTPGSAIFKGINELLPAHTQCLEKGRSVRSAYWRLGYQEHTENLSDTAEHVRYLLENSITSQMDGASMLSGGLDSSIIAAVAAKDHDLATYSVDYQENAQYFSANLFQPDADGTYIDAMVGSIGSMHTQVLLHPDDLAAQLQAAMRLRDAPGMADIDSSLLLFCKEIAKKHTNVLSGEGSDEIFGGYPWFYRPELNPIGRFPWSSDMEYRQSFMSSEFRGGVDLLAYARDKMRITLMTAPEYGGSDPAESEKRSLFYLNMRWFMANLIDRSDRMGAGAGVSIRMPFANNDLLTYVFNIPWTMKYTQAKEKGLLRKAFEGTLPERVLNRKKSPYPKTFHPAYSSAVSRLLEEELKAGSPLCSLVSETSLRTLMNDRSIGRPWYGQLMSGPQLMGFMVQLGMWMREYRVQIHM